MKALMYCRVSTDMQKVDRQETDIENYCKVRNFEIVERFIEYESGLHKERVELTRMMKYVDDNPVDVIVVSEISRLGRTSKVLETIENLSDKKISVHSLKEKLETLDENKNPNFLANLQISFLSGINRFELETTKYRVKSGIRSRLMDGKHVGGLNIPFGYKKDKTGKLIKNENEIQIVKDIFNMYLSGKGTQQIANHLNRTNIKTRYKQSVDEGLNTNNIHYQMKFVDGTIYRMLTNTIYIGIRKHRTKKIDGYKTKYETEDLILPDLRIIDDETFNKVQERFNSHINKNGPVKKFEYILENRKIKCGICNNNYAPHQRSDVDGRKKDKRYICMSRRKDGNCGNYGISIDKIEDLVQFVVLDQFDVDFMNSIEDNTFLYKMNDIKDEIETYEGKYNHEVIKEGRLVDTFINGNMTKNVYLSRFQPIKDAQQVYMNKISELKEKYNKVETSFNSFIDFKKIKFNFDKNNTKLPKEIINKIISTITIYPIELKPLYNNLMNKLHIWGKFTSKLDKIILVVISNEIMDFKYIISQREKYIYDLQDYSIKYTKDDGQNFHSFYIPVDEIDDDFIN